MLKSSILRFRDDFNFDNFFLKICINKSLHNLGICVLGFNELPNISGQHRSSIN